MARENWLFYDCEIINCIPDRNAPNDPELTYCSSWDDYRNMGISCIATYFSGIDSYRIFKSNQFAEFQGLVDSADHVIGFNSKSFDDKLCAVNGLRIKTTYDLLSETWIAAGLPPRFTRGLTVAGYNLQQLAQENLGMGKSASGELAPVLWQQGKKHAVYTYCLFDVYLSVEILKLGWQGELIDPLTGESLKLAPLS